MDYIAHIPLVNFQKSYIFSNTVGGLGYVLLYGWASRKGTSHVVKIYKISIIHKILSVFEKQTYIVKVVLSKNLYNMIAKTIEVVIV